MYIEIINITNSYEDSYKIMLFLIKENDIFSIRRYGKYKFISIVNTTRKDNYIIRYQKYI